MAACKGCNKSGFFLKVNHRGLCENCSNKIEKELWECRHVIDNYPEIFNQINNLNERIEICNDVIKRAELLKLYENKGLITINPTASEIITRANLSIERTKNKLDKNYEIQENIEVKVSGVSQHNDDGISRQEILQKCEIGEELELKHSSFKQGVYGIKIFRKNGEQIGWVSRKLAPDVVGWLKDGKLVEGIITEILAPDNSMNIYGCSICLMVYSKKYI